MRILIGTVEIASLVYVFAEGFRKLGHQVTSVMLQRNRYYSHFNYDIERDGILEPQELEALIDQHDIFVFVWAERGLTVNKEEYRLLRERGKKIVSIFCGSDVRHASAYRQQYGVPIDELWDGEDRVPLNFPLVNVRYQELFSDLIVSLPNNTPLSVRPYMQMYLPLILERYECNVPGRNIPVVVHAPSDKSVKGTDVIVKALERLRADGIEFEFSLLHGISNEEILPALRNADVVIDQLYLPHTGVLGLEAMASGCAVASWNREEFDPLPAQRPVWYLDTHNIYEQLKRLLTDKGLRCRLARDARLFVEKHHDHCAVPQRIVKLLTDGIAEYDHYPSFFLRSYRLADGISIPKELQDVTTTIIKRWGIPADLDPLEAAARGLLSVEGLEPLEAIPRWPVNPKTFSPEQRLQDINMRIQAAQDASARGDLATARGVLTACISTYPYHPEAYFKHALMDMDAGDKDNARVLLDHLELLAPEYPGLSEARKCLYTRSTDFKENGILKTELENFKIRFDRLIPRIFTIETSVACELKCPECALGSGLLRRKKGFMSFEQFKVIADKISPLQPAYIYLHMYGEPMINPDIIRIIKYASTFSKTNISTNGMAMTEHMAEELITSGVSDIIVSIDGMTQEVYAAYRKGGDVRKAFNALELLVKYNNIYGNRVVISPQFVAFKHNQHEMQAFFDYCGSVGLAPSFKSPHLRRPSLYENSDFSALTRKLLPDLATQRQEMSNCSDPREVFTIQMDGSVIVCCYDYAGQTTFGNIFEKDVMEIWNGPNYQKFRWNIVTGNAPDFCINNCLLYLCEKPCPPSFEKIMAMKEGLSNIASGNNLPGSNQTKTINDNSCLFLNTYYVAFLNHFYRIDPQMAGMSYEYQIEALQKARFGDSDFYSKGLSQAGWKAQNLIVNCPPLQTAWAQENDFSANTGPAILIEQIRRIKPAVVYFQDPNIATPDVLNQIRDYSQLIVLQIASPIPEHIDFSIFDIVITAAPHFVELFRQKAAVACYYQPLAFDPRCVVKTPPYQNRSIDVSFVGGLSNLHINSYNLFEHLAVTTPINFWGYGADTLPPESAVRFRHHGEAWGTEMFKILANSRITINRHGEIAESYACNMRLFEATGSGALLITDYKDNLNELFEIGKEVVAYHSPEECAALANYYLAHPVEAERIARAGQQRTLRDHTYAHRMAQTATIFERHIRYRKERDLFEGPDYSRISYGHADISEGDITETHITAWQSPSIPARQRALVQQELERVYRGEGAPAYRVLAEIIKPYIKHDTSVLELGCSSGYCYELLEYYLNRSIDYTGIDYSQAMIDMAKSYYPQATFLTADGASLAFAAREFQVVISSCVLLHVPNWRRHVSETVRVADMFVVVSRTPICRKKTTHYMKKFAYDVETVEIRFNEAEIVREFMIHGLELIDAIQYSTDPAKDEYEVTYLFKRPA